MWPVLAELLDVPVAAPLPMSLADVMADKAPVWDGVVAEHDTVPTHFADVSSWGFGDAVFGWDYDFLSDSSKARRFGFTEHVDTRAMFAQLTSDLRRQRSALPPPPSPPVNSASDQGSSLDDCVSLPAGLHGPTRAAAGRPEAGIQGYHHTPAPGHCGRTDGTVSSATIATALTPSRESCSTRHVILTAADPASR